ncbi:Ig-like domain-containing protein [Flavobacterium sp. 3HN19-14]|uniref:Ig-like domain-containing protein n=1 Tax=Flavobacterium sp. 3HN19-14 TaxID=3448133 RepID=UPI003EE141CD
MLKATFRAVLILFAVFMVGCAKRGTITGGDKDTIPPVLEMSIPKNFSTDFKGREVKLYFDEYVKLKDVNKQLVVSPPMNTAPEIFPTNASKIITIRIKDTLKPNTTYSFNFGESIRDNNESIPYPQFKYVLSTGSYIDSLSIEGSIKDALEKKTDNFVKVMLYEINDTYTDSIVYKEKPRYVTNTLDSLTTWKIENIRAGKYLLVALKDNNNNYKFNPKGDKIGFYTTPVEIPTTEKYELKLFSEKGAFKAVKPFQASANRAIVGYEGDPTNAKFEVRNGNEILQSVVTQFPEKDSVQVWYKPIKTDSLKISVTKDQYSKEFTFKTKGQEKDSLNISGSSGTLHFRDLFSLKSSTPIVSIDSTKISVRSKDSTAVAFTTNYDEFNQRLDFNFKKEPLEKYTIRLMPGALTDLMEQSNDTLAFKVSTRNLSEYGYMKLTLKNAKSFPIIVELTDEKGKILATEYAETSPEVIFEGLQPNDNIFVRLIYDTNKNGLWDSGNFLEKRQAEEVFYYTTPLKVKGNWDVLETIDLGG